jgi:integrase
VKRPKSRRTVKLHSQVVESPRSASRKPARVAQVCRRPLDRRRPDFHNEDRKSSRRAQYREQDFIRILEAAELPTTFRLYDLRHTAATLAPAAGIPPKIVSGMLGHASAAFTLDVYSHVLPHMQDTAVQKVEALLRRGKRK